MDPSIDPAFATDPARRPAAPRPASRRGAAMLLVMVAVLIVGVVASSFLLSQSTTTSISTQVEDHAEARGVAESGVSFAVSHLLEQDDWRTALTPGQWVEAVGVPGGTVDLRFDDDTGDFTDDASAPVFVTAVGYAGNASFRARARVVPASSGGSPALLLVASSTALGTTDAKKQALFESWGYAVTVIAEGDAAASDVVYVSETVSSGTVNTKLRDVSAGVVIEEGYLADDFELSSTGSGSASALLVDVVDDGHPITAEFGAGSLQVGSSALPMRTYSGLAGGTATLVESATGSPVLVVADVGDALHSGTAAGRRVLMPFGDTGWDPDDLHADGEQLLRNALEWAAAAPTPATDAILHYTFAEQAGAAVNDTAGRLNINLAHNAGNGTLTWVDDDDGGTGLFFDQDANAGTASVRAASATAADLLKDALADTDAMTIQVLVRPLGFDTGDGRIVSYANDQADANTNFALMGGSGGATFDAKTRVKHAAGVTDGEAQGNALADDTLQVLTWTLDLNQSSDNNVIYVDGAPLRTASTPGDLDDWASAMLSLGNAGSANRPFRGTLYDVQLFDRALAPAEVLVNAQALLAGADGDDVEPTLIVHYAFDQPAPVTPSLVGHWPLDARTATGVGAEQHIGVGESLDLPDGTLIDSYNSLAGPYDPATAGAAGKIASNTTTYGRVQVDNGSVFNADIFVGPGGDPSGVIFIDSAGVHNGSTGVLTEAIDVSDPADPSGFPPSSGPRDDTATTTVLGHHGVSTLVTYSTWRVFSGSTVTIRGDVAVDVRQDFRIDSSSIVLDNNATLRLYVGELAVINNAQVNPDSARTHDLTLINYGPGIDQDFRVLGNSVIAGLLRAADDVELQNGAVIYGTIFAEDDLKKRDGNGGSPAPQVHLDVSLSLAGDSYLDQSLLSDGTAHGGVHAANGTIDGAVYFDGDNGYVEVPHDDTHLLDAGTVAFWVYPTALGGWQGLVCKDSADRDTGGQLRILADGSAVEARLESANTDFVVRSSSGVLSDNAWHHVALGFGPWGLRLYVDGVLVDSDDYSGGLGTTAAGAGNYEPWAFGANADATGNGDNTGLRDFFAGRLDDVRLYDQNLDATQAANLASGADPGPQSSYTVADVSGFGDPYDLRVIDPAGAAWAPGGGLVLDGTTAASSTDPATKVLDAVQATGGYTVVIDFDRSDAGVSTGTELFSLEDDAAGDFIEIEDDGNGVAGVHWRAGSSSHSDTAASAIGTARQQLVFTYDGANATLYRDGVEVFTRASTGDLDDLDAASVLALGHDLNYASGAGGFVGTLYEVRVYDGGVDQGQVDNLAAGDGPGPAGGAGGGGSGGGAFEFRWIGGPD